MMVLNNSDLGAISAEMRKRILCIGNPLENTDFCREAGVARCVCIKYPTRANN